MLRAVVGGGGLRQLGVADLHVAAGGEGELARVAVAALALEHVAEHLLPRRCAQLHEPGRIKHARTRLPEILLVHLTPVARVRALVPHKPQPTGDTFLTVANVSTAMIRTATAMPAYFMANPFSNKRRKVPDPKVSVRSPKPTVRAICAVLDLHITLLCPDTDYKERPFY